VLRGFMSIGVAQKAIAVGDPRLRRKVLRGFMSIGVAQLLLIQNMARHEESRRSMSSSKAKS
jgi:hypothetical protein